MVRRSPGRRSPPKIVFVEEPIDCDLVAFPSTPLKTGDTSSSHQEPVPVLSPKPSEQGYVIHDELKSESNVCVIVKSIFFSFLLTVGLMVINNSLFM